MQSRTAQVGSYEDNLLIDQRQRTGKVDRDERFAFASYFGGDTDHLAFFFLGNEVQIGTNGTNRFGKDGFRSRKGQYLRIVFIYLIREFSDDTDDRDGC